METAGGYASASAETRLKCITKTSPLAVCSPVAVCQRAGSLALKISQSSNNIYMNNERPTPETDANAGYPDFDSGCWKYNKLGLYVGAYFARKLERQRDEALEALREAWFAMDELVDVPDRIINWQNKYAYTLEETK